MSNPDGIDLGEANAVLAAAIAYLDRMGRTATLPELPQVLDDLIDAARRLQGVTTDE